MDTDAIQGLGRAETKDQLRFNQVFLRSMIGRLQNAERGASS